MFFNIGKFFPVKNVEAWASTSVEQNNFVLRHFGVWRCPQHNANYEKYIYENKR